MASDGSPGAISGVSAILSIQSTATAIPTAAANNALPQGGNTAPPAPATVSAISRAAVTSSANGATNSAQAKSTALSSADSQSVVDQLNKHLNSSGRADQFRVNPESDQYIQQVNPANGTVVAEYSVSEFPALARSIGASGLLIDDLA